MNAMDPILLSMFAAFAFAAQHTILARISVPATVLQLMNLLPALIGLGLCIAVNQWPKDGHEWMWLGTAGLLLAIGSYLLGLAYAQHVYVVPVTTVIALIPLFAAFINWMTGGTLPNVRELFASLLAVTSVVLLVWK